MIEMEKKKTFISDNQMTNSSSNARLMLVHPNSGQEFKKSVFSTFTKVTSPVIVRVNDSDINSHHS